MATGVAETQTKTGGVYSNPLAQSLTKVSQIQYTERLNQKRQSFNSVPLVPGDWGLLIYSTCRSAHSMPKLSLGNREI